MMKGRLSFVVSAARRPSQKPGEETPKSPKNANGGGGGVDDMPEPEFLTTPQPVSLSSPTNNINSNSNNNNNSASGGGDKAGRASDLGAIGATGGDGKDAADTSSPPNAGVTGRKKSYVDMKRKTSGMALSGSDEDADENEAQIFPSSVREGYLKKKGVVNIAWKKRYLVLLPQQLAYYDEKPKTADAVPKGFMTLTSITKVEHHAESSAKDFMFDVVTPTRIYRLQANSVADMDAWIAAISGTAANAQQQLASRKRNVSHVAAMLMNDGDRLKADISLGISHENAELRNWANWNTFEVAAWLQTFGMARYSAAFYEKGITGAALRNLDKKMLHECGVEEAGDLAKIQSHVKQLISGR